MGNLMIGGYYPPNLGDITKIMCGTEQCWPNKLNKISINFIWRTLSHEIIKVETDTIEIDPSKSGKVSLYTSQTLSSTGITITVRTDNLSSRGITSYTSYWRKFNWDFTPELSEIQVQNTGDLFIPFSAVNNLNETYVYSITLMETTTEHNLWAFFHKGTVTSKIIDAYYIPISVIGITGRETIGEWSSARPILTIDGILYARVYLIRNSTTEYDVQFETLQSGRWRLGGYGSIKYENNRARWTQSSYGIDIVI